MYPHHAFIPRCHSPLPVSLLCLLRYRRRRTGLTDSGGFLLPLPPLPSLCTASPVPSSRSHHVLASVFQRSRRRARKSGTVSRVTNTQPSSSTPPPPPPPPSAPSPCILPPSFNLPRTSPPSFSSLLNFVTKGTYFSPRSVYSVCRSVPPRQSTLISSLRLTQRPREHRVTDGQIAGRERCRKSPGKAARLHQVIPNPRISLILFIYYTLHLLPSLSY